MQHADLICLVFNIWFSFPKGKKGTLSALRDQKEHFKRALSDFAFCYFAHKLVTVTNYI